jgi:glycosyltransferase involved in cell wall biosynthesis
MEKSGLLISYYFPPVGGGGVQRTAKFVKYLHCFGWNPVVLTVQRNVYEKTGRVIDETLLVDIPEEVRIIRTKSLDLLRVSKSVKRVGRRDWKSVAKMLINRIGGIFVNPDAQMLWIPIAVLAGLRAIREYGVRIIYSTANPWSSHIVGLILKRITGLPWIADYRDAWNLNPYTKLASSFRRSLQLLMERMVVAGADRIIFTAKGTQSDYEKFFGSGKMATIRNGFDPEDFTRVKPQSIEKFSILYSGSVWSYRKLDYFVHALSQWLKSNPQARSDTVVNFMGIIDEDTISLIERVGLGSVCNTLGYLPHRKSISYLLGSDVLFITLDEGGESVIPGKLYEYMASGSAILALLPLNGIAAKILREEERGDYLVSPRDIQGTMDKIALLYRQYKEGNLPKYPPVKNLASYTRKEATRQLNDIMCELIE